MADDFAVQSEAQKAAIAEVIANAKRLIQDAQRLIDVGSQASALSLAILAFEEAGKGHIIELGIKKPKVVRSSHEFRHAVALNVLGASLYQKYSVQLGAAAEKIEAHHRRHGVRPGKKVPLTPISQALREELRADLMQANPHLGNVDVTTFLLESRWITKIGEVVAHGGAEKLRQSGLYVDVDPDSYAITNTPSSIQPLEAQRWIWAASRVLNLLENGEFRQNYSPLSSLISEMGWTGLPMTELAERFAQIWGEHAENMGKKRDADKPGQRGQ